MVPSTVNRVPRHTAARVNKRIRRQTDENVACIAAAGQEAIGVRLAELDREWDIERTLEANAAALALAGVALGVAVDKRYLAALLSATASLKPGTLSSITKKPLSHCSRIRTMISWPSFQRDFVPL